jgi:methylmalonyl-CoA epimerase
MIKGVYGFNIAVKDLDAAIVRYQNLLGLQPTKLLGDGDFAFPGLKGAVFNVHGVILNLITSSDSKTGVGKFLETKGEGLFLLSLRSDNVAEDTKQMTEAGAAFVMKEPLVGSFGTANFIHPKSAHGVQIEIYDPAE